MEVGAGLDSEEKWGSLSLHPTLHPSVPTFLLYTPSPANLLHPEWLQGWDSGVLLLHGYRLLVCRPVGRGAPVSPQASYFSCASLPSTSAEAKPYSDTSYILQPLKPESSVSQTSPSDRPNPSPAISSQHTPPRLCPPVPTEPHTIFPSLTENIL